MFQQLVTSNFIYVFNAANRQVTTISSTKDTNNASLNSEKKTITSNNGANNTKSNTKHKNLNVSYTVYGMNSGGLSGSISRDSSTSNSQQTTHPTELTPLLPMPKLAP
jgi:hypothetical protein